MSFLFPAFLLGALTAAIPIILHLRKRERAPRVAFSDVRLLQRAPVTEARQRRLRELLLLALRVTALVLLAVAFARPFVDRSGLGRALTVVAVDRSLSMSAPGQLARARVLAANAVTDAPAGHLVAVVAFDDRAEVVQEPTGDRRMAAAAAAGLMATPGATRFGPALIAAGELIGAREGTIVVVTDLQQAGWDADTRVAVPAGVAIDVAAVEPVHANRAVTALERTATGFTTVVLNAAETPRQARVSLAVDGAILDQRSVTLEPGPTDIVFDAVTPAAGVAVVEVDDPEGYAWDDRRYALLDPPEPDRLLAIVRDGRLDDSAFFLDRALRVGMNGSRFALDPRSPGAVSSLDAALWEDTTGVVLLATDGLDRRARARLAELVAAGGGLLIVAGPHLDPAIVGDTLGDAHRLRFEPATAARHRWSVTESRHPIFRAFGEQVGMLGEVRFDRVAPIVETDGARVLARFDDGAPALVEYDVGAGRALVLATDLNNAWNDFPRRPSYVPFVHEMASYLVGASRRMRDVVVADVPPGVSRAPGPATRPGSNHGFVVNVDPRESDPAPIAPPAFLERLDPRSTAGPPPTDSRRDATRQDAERQENEQSYWWYALLAAFVVLAAETWLSRTMA